jgi:hypothetical protein
VHPENDDDARGDGRLVWGDIGYIGISSSRRNVSRPFLHDGEVLRPGDRYLGLVPAQLELEEFVIREDRTFPVCLVCVV